ncbi:MAG TPA: glycosyltransferase family 39 protein, partial [Thermoanaerobaculia bacterium]|nr:glycosyltransferase family 39 protein [Thermoanaerobaculia bacterium]
MKSTSGGISDPRSEGGWLRRDWLLLVLPLVAFALYLGCSNGYGYFRDELYYRACSRHMAWGYVDQPPLSIAILYLVRVTLGVSRLAIHVVPALAGATTLLLTGLIVRYLNGGRYAQSLAMASVLVAPLFLAINTFYSMNSLDIVWWTLAAYLLVRILEGQEARWWPLLGVVLGLGLMNKISVLWLGLGLAVGLLATRQRRWLATKGPWIAACTAMVIFLPYVLWQVRWDWPTLEFMHNATTYKMASISPFAFLSEQVLDLQPLTLPIWLTGLVWSLVSRRGRRLRPLGIAWLTVLAILLLNGKSRASYLGPAYPMLLAMGAVAIAHWCRRRGWRWVPAAALTIVVVGGAVTAPAALPVLPVKEHIEYTEMLGLTPHSAEQTKVAALPQIFADRFGWPSLVRKVAAVYESLSASER